MVGGEGGGLGGVGEGGCWGGWRVCERRGRSECVRGGEGVELAGWMVGGGVRVSGGTLVCVEEEGTCIAGVTGAGVVTGCVVRTEAGWLGSEEA